MHICETPLESVAERAKVTETDFVYVALLLMEIEPVGGVVSVRVSVILTPPG
ncbi:MAG: hypothetical protein AABX69_04555 [Nanoarchaeota archaeon]